MTTLEIPSNPKELENQSLVDLTRYLPTTANPFMQESWMGAQAIANARRIFDFYKQLEILAQEAIPITAVQFLAMWASFWGVTKNAATVATGNIIATGTLGSTITSGHTLTSSDGITYTTTSTVSITNNVVACTLTAIDNLVTVVLSADVSMYDGQSVTITGATTSQYNGTFTITQTGTNTFTYVATTTPTNSPATGNATFASAVIPIQSVDFGTTQNQLPNAKLVFTASISGVNSNTFVDQGGIGGGAEIESDESLRSRLLSKVQNPVAHFNVAEITSIALTIPNVRDVFVQEATPALGRVTIYFTMNLTNPIPTGDTVTSVKDAILTIKPANTAPDDVIVAAPNPIALNLVISNLYPNTSTMKTAITNNVKAMLLDQGIVGFPITLNQLIATIQDSIDPNSGVQVSTFVITSPINDVGGAVGAYVTFGSVTFS